MYPDESPEGIQSRRFVSERTKVMSPRPETGKNPTSKRSLVPSDRVVRKKGNRGGQKHRIRRSERVIDSWQCKREEQERQSPGDVLRGLEFSEMHTHSQQLAKSLREEFEENRRESERRCQGQGRRTLGSADGI